MHKPGKTRANGKKLLLLLSLILVLTMTVGASLAYLWDKTPTLRNIFTPYEDLVITKQVKHPFGKAYTLPEGLAFDFEVELPEEYEGQTLITSLGDVTVTGGKVTLRIPVGVNGTGSVTLYGLDEEDKVIVTEKLAEDSVFEVDQENQWLTIAHNTQASLTFINKYTPDPAPTGGLTLTGTKKVDSADGWQDGETFSFQLQHKNAAGEWVNVGEPATVTKDAYTFDLTDALQRFAFDTMGVYPFRVVEQSDKAVAGPQYFDVTVGDVDMDGALEIQNVTKSQSAVTVNGEYDVVMAFVNRYPAGTIKIEKQMVDQANSGRGPEGFRFELEDESGRKLTSEPTTAAGEASFELLYTYEDVGKTFKYVLREVDDGAPGVVYDTTEYDVTVLVTYDDSTGSVGADILYAERAEAEPITQPADEAGAPQEEPTGGDVPGTPTEGGVETDPAAQPGNENADETGAPQEEPTGDDVPGTPTEGGAETDPAAQPGSEPAGETSAPTTEPGTEPAAQSMDEPELDAQSDTEPEPTEPAPADDEAAVQPLSARAGGLTVMPLTNTDGGDGDQESESDTDLVGEPVDPPVFVNFYSPKEAKHEIRGTKTLDGRGMKDGEFTFELYETGSDFVVAEGAEPLDTANNERGSFAFDRLTFAKASTRYFVVKEDASASLGGIIYDTAEYHVTLTAAPNAEGGALAVTETVTAADGSAKPLVFTNQYEAAPYELYLSGRKELEGGTLTDGAFRFELYAYDEAADGGKGERLGTAANDAEGKFAFDKQLLDTEGQPYRYLVVEDTSAAEEGMTYDESAYLVTVTVKDDGKGSMVLQEQTITKLGEDGVLSEILFKNVYAAPTPTPTVEPTATPEPTATAEPTPTAKPTATPKPAEAPTAAPTTAPASDNPLTGDSSNAMLYALLMAAGVLTAALVLYTGRRRKRG